MAFGCAASSGFHREPQKVTIGLQAGADPPAGDVEAHVRVDGQWCLQAFASRDGASSEIPLSVGPHEITVSLVTRTTSNKVPGYETPRVFVWRHAFTTDAESALLVVSVTKHAASPNGFEVRFEAGEHVRMGAGAPPVEGVAANDDTRALDALIDAALTRGDPERAACLSGARRFLLDALLRANQDADGAALRGVGAQQLEQAKSCGQPAPSLEDICKVQPEACAQIDLQNSTLRPE